MASDRNGHLLSDYPGRFQNGRLVGLTNEGLAAYHTDTVVFLAELTDDTVTTPPIGYSRWHGIDLEGFEWTLGEYIVETVHDQGPWRALTEYGEYHIRQIGQSRIGIVQ